MGVESDECIGGPAKSQDALRATGGRAGQGRRLLHAPEPAHEAAGSGRDKRRNQNSRERASARETLALSPGDVRRGGPCESRTVSDAPFSGA